MKMKHKMVHLLGMELEEWTHKSCTAHFGVGDTWATLYDIQSKEEGKNHATELLLEAKAFYESQGKKFGGSIALNERMRKIYQKLQIKEFLNEENENGKSWQEI